jgi:hypothetical protein
MEKKRKKMATGTAVKGYLENPYQELAQNDINQRQAQLEVSTNPLVRGLDVVGQMGVQYGLAAGGFESIEGIDPEMGEAANGALSLLSGLNMAMGGKVHNVPVEVEGEEVAETPNKQLLDFKGPSHEQGGIDVDLPEGTEVFSKRIKLDGQTMAERKKKRERTLNKLRKSLGENPTNQIDKKTLERTQTNFDAEEEKDKMVQMLIKEAMEPAQRAEHKYGNRVGGDPDPYAHLLPKQPKQFTMDSNQLQRIEGDSFLDYEKNIPLGSTEVSARQPDTFDKIKMLLNKVSNVDIPESSMPTPGDAVGIAGNLMSMYGPLNNTLRNRAGDTPNINAFENFGTDAIDSNRQAMEYVDDVEDRQLQDLELSRVAQTKRNRGGAKGINTMRALDLASNQIADNQKSQVRSQSANQMMQLLGRESQLENQRDRMVMQGEYQRDIADRQDRDAFYSNMAQNLVGRGEGVQQIGKEINQIKQREVVENLLANLSKYGITVDKKGNLIQKKKENE